MRVHPNLEQESQLLKASWMHRDKDVLKDYLVQGFCNPKIHIQSILTRHFLIEAVFGNLFENLMKQEIVFAIEMNMCLQEEAKRLYDTFFAYSCDKNSVKKCAVLAEKWGTQERLDVFQNTWKEVLSQHTASLISVIEPACGSANDYRFFHTYGIARFLKYKGFDIAQPNIENAQHMFPEVEFEEGDMLHLKELNESFDYLIVHDLFEHFSLKALEHSMKEACRVARKGMVWAFFNMSDHSDHRVAPLRKYHWNLLSREKIEAFLKQQGWTVRVVKMTELLADYDYHDYYNKNAYTFFATR